MILKKTGGGIIKPIPLPQPTTENYYERPIKIKWRVQRLPLEIYRWHTIKSTTKLKRFVVLLCISQRGVSLFAPVQSLQ